MNAPSDRTRRFLETAHLYRLGRLVTESPNPRTLDLARQSQEDLETATRVFRDVEIDALQVLLETVDLAAEVVKSFSKCFDQGGRVFLVGCGATGRLALVLETIWRAQPARGLEESVIAFTAGGDFALVRSLGVFEDRPELGARHLLDLGFQEGDVLVAITEGGETPFVLGALEQATITSSSKSWLFFCNPKELLIQAAERSKRALLNPRVRSHAFEIEPMALTGSTRLQASSVLMAFVGACLRELATGAKARWLFTEIVDLLYQTEVNQLIPMIEAEARAHEARQFTLHRSRSAPIAVLTDTTERAPTFSLAPFESNHDQGISKDGASRTYLEIPGTTNSQEAWRRLLGRSPRPFRAPEVQVGGKNVTIDLDAIYGFDFSEGVAQRRTKLGFNTDLHLDVEIDSNSDRSILKFRTEDTSGKIEHATFRVSNDLLVQQALLKYALNLQSTLTMGRIGRFHGNLMTFVRPTNGKLIDRALRTLRILASQTSGVDHLAESPDDTPFLDALFAALDRVSPDESVALKALEILRIDHSSHKR